MARNAKRNQLIKFPIFSIVENVMDMMMSFLFRLSAKTARESIALSNPILDKIRKSSFVTIRLYAAFPSWVISPYRFACSIHGDITTCFNRVLSAVKWVIDSIARIRFYEPSSKHRMGLAEFPAISSRLPIKIVLFAGRKSGMKRSQFRSLLSCLHIDSRSFVFWLMQFRIGLRTIHRSLGRAHMAKTALASARCSLTALWTECFIHVSYPFKRYYETLLRYCQYGNYYILGGKF